MENKQLGWKNIPVFEHGQSKLPSCHALVFIYSYTSTCCASLCGMINVLGFKTPTKESNFKL